jgi:glycosyltransferase involved in cell wall biosynthesis/cellobiose-specific phosphotransferase system component IIB
MTELPRVSLFVFCYQQAEFIEHAMKAALAQDYGNLQIIVSDDHSSDHSFHIIEQLATEYQGPHQLTLNRNSSNLGIGRHFIHIMEHLVDGELVVASGGDDISAPNRVSRIVEQWLQQGKPALIAHALEEIDEQGQPFAGSRTVQYRLQKAPDKWSLPFALQQYLHSPFPLPFIGAALAYRTDIYRLFGTPQAEPAYEDHLMYFRALLSDGLHYFPEILVKYRRHRNNFTAKPAKPKAKSQAIPELYTGFVQNPTLFQSVDLAVFRLHQLTTQQWLDYQTHIKTCGEVDLSVAAELWQQLSRRHSELQQYQTIPSSKLKRLANQLTLACSALSWHLGVKKYRYQSALAEADYVQPLRTVVFGAGSGGEKTLMALGGAFQVVAVCDNNSKLHNGTFCGLPVISPLQLKDMLQQIDCIVIASTFFYDIKAKLTEELGIPAAKISRASYGCITQAYPAQETTALINGLLLPGIAISVTALLILLSLSLF